MNTTKNDLQELKNRKILVAGTIFMDIKGYPQGEFLPTGRNIGRIEYQYGGVGRNVAYDLAGLGAAPVFLSLSEGEGHGAAILEELRAAGVNTGHILHDTNGIGTWMAIMNSDGDVYANLSRRQDMKPLCGLLEGSGDALFEGADGILVEMDMDEAVIAQIFALAERHHVDVYGVISNMTVAMERFPYIQKTRCFICNRQEAGMLFYRFGADGTERISAEDSAFADPSVLPEVAPADQNRLAAALTEASSDLPGLLQEALSMTGISCMVVTMDKDGALFADKKEAGMIPASPVNVVDTTGAGDAFFTGTAAALICGRSLAEACRLGNQMAANVIASTENIYRPQ